jgi:hypothetical protein
MLVVFALLAALTVPAAAYPAPGRGAPKGPKASVNTTRQAETQRRFELLKERIATALQRRNAGFENAATRISQRITRVSSIAERVEAAGGDVSVVRASLDRARGLLDKARAEEAAAVGLFKAVPSATDRKAVFSAAKAQAKVARQTLAQARLTVRNAVLDLRAVANGLKGTRP